MYLHVYTSNLIVRVWMLSFAQQERKRRVVVPGGACRRQRARRRPGERTDGDRGTRAAAAVAQSSPRGRERARTAVCWNGRTVEIQLETVWLWVVAEPLWGAKCVVRVWFGGRWLLLFRAWVVGPLGCTGWAGLHCRLAAHRER